MPDRSVRIETGAATKGRPDAAGWFAGTDLSQHVVVELDGPGRVVRARLEPGWRAAVGPPGVGVAVLQALRAAVLERLAGLAVQTGWAEPPLGGPHPHQDPVGAEPLGAVRGGSAPADLAGISRVLADLREFRRQLADSHTAARPVATVGVQVRVTVQHSQIVRVEPDEQWVAVASDEEIERHLGLALSTALTTITETPGRALTGCPDLLEVLHRTGAALPFPLPAPAGALPAPAPIRAPTPPRDSDPSLGTPPVGRWTAAGGHTATAAPRAAPPVPTTNPDW